LPNNVTLYVPRDNKTASVQNWQLSIQREIFSNMVLDVAYVGNRAKNLVILADYNQARPFTAAEAALPAAQRPSLQARRPIRDSEQSRRFCPKAFPNTTRCKSNSNAVSQMVCISLIHSPGRKHWITLRRFWKSRTATPELRRTFTTSRRQRNRGLRPAFQQHDELRF
jgi:hypothetical protein